MTGIDIFRKALKTRNKIFHAPKQELGETELTECIDDIIKILEDDKELKERSEAKQAVEKLKQLKHKDFIITTYNEEEVCRAAMASVVNRAEELEQMTKNAKAEIELKGEEISKSVEEKSHEALDETLQKVEKQTASHLEPIKQTTELLKERVRQLELDNADIKQRLTEIEKDKEMIKAAQDINQKQLNYIQQKQDFQRELVERYQKHYVRTRISPLKCQEDDISIEKVYVSPDMVVQEKSAPKNEEETTEQNTEKDNGIESNTLTGKADTKTTENKRDKSNLRTINVNGYSDIFRTAGLKNRKIYIVGDVGTGKSCFSKMMIYNWCKSIRQDNSLTTQEPESSSRNQNIGSDEYSTTDSKDIELETDDIQTMRQFNFLFFIPLQRLSAFGSDIREMIKEMYKDLHTSTLIDKIFEQESEQCCIILDGLDEWTPPKQSFSPQHISYGIPNGDGVHNATLVTLSRPCARGILNLKSSECDRKIELRGVNETTLPQFTRKYMSILGESETSVTDFIEEITAANFRHLEKTPMILQQLIWMFSTRKDIGTSKSDIYCYIINIMLGWTQNKDDEYSNDDAAVVPEEFEQMQLPELLRRFDRCQTNKRILFILSKLSFKTVADDMPSCIFGRAQLLNCGLSKPDIAFLIKIGIIEESNRIDPTFEQTCFSFIHFSYLEFFAAVYMSVCYHSLQNPTPTKRRKLEDAYEDLFSKIKSTTDILRLSNVLIMLCGLSPWLVGKVSSSIAEVVKSDERMIIYRENLCSEDQEESELIQTLLHECLLETEMNRQPAAISLPDMFISADVDMSFIRQINPESVLSLCIYDSLFTDTNVINMIARSPDLLDWFDRLRDMFDWIAKLPNLQFACIEIDGIPCEYFDDFLKSLKNVVSLRQLVLYETCLINNRELAVKGCKKLKECHGHCIDLSKHDLLECFHSEFITCIELTGIPTKNLERFYISGSSVCRAEHELFELLSSHLENAVSLKHLRIEAIGCDDFCSGHIMDLSKHCQLKIVYLECLSCKLGSAASTHNLEEFSMVNTSCPMKHEICEQLASSLMQAVSLKVLRLENVKEDCLRSTHQIDLSKHNQLENVYLVNCDFSLSAVNSKTVVVETSRLLPSFTEGLEGLLVRSSYSWGILDYDYSCTESD